VKQASEVLSDVLFLFQMSCKMSCIFSDCAGIAATWRGSIHSVGAFYCSVGFTTWRRWYALPGCFLLFTRLHNMEEVGGGTVRDVHSIGRWKHDVSRKKLGEVILLVPVHWLDLRLVPM